MYVGVVQLTVAIDHSHSLKEKRVVIRRIKDRVRERLGVAISEVGELERWQRAALGCAIAAGERQQAQRLIDEVIRVATAAAEGQVIAIARDVWTFDAPAAPIAPAGGAGEPAERAAERTGSGDKAMAGDDWIPDAWRDEP